MDQGTNNLQLQRSYLSNNSGLEDVLFCVFVLEAKDLHSLVPRLPSPGNEKRAKTEGSLVEFKSRAPLPLLHLTGHASKIASRQSLMRARPLKWSNGSGARDLNSTRLPSVLARFSFPGERSLGTRLWKT